METSNKKVTTIYNYELVDFAYFEDRRFERSFCEEFIFIKKIYLKNRFPAAKTTILNYDSQEKPLSLSERNWSSFIAILELKKFLSNDNYNLVLTELVAKSDSYDQINIIIKFLLEHKSFDFISINTIIELALKKWVVKKSFNAQRYIINLVYRNIDLIELSLIERVLTDFPHRTTSILKSEKEKHNELVKKVEFALHEKLNNAEIYNLNFKSNKSSTKHVIFDEKNNEDVYEDEIRKMNLEDPSWRIANDLD